LVQAPLLAIVEQRTLGRVQMQQPDVPQGRNKRAISRDICSHAAQPQARKDIQPFCSKTGCRLRGKRGFRLLKYILRRSIEIVLKAVSADFAIIVVAWRWLVVVVR